ncbi:MAG TPA: hypothetical protein VIF43_02835 [Patescibacteria group bacterium]|jgi:hypothetical protein
MAALGLGVATAVAITPVGPHFTVDAPMAKAAETKQGVDDAKDVSGGKTKQKKGKQDTDKNGLDTSGSNIDPVTGTEVKKTSVIQYVNAVYLWVAFIGGLLSVISLIYAGYTYMASYGDPEKISNAKDIVEKTLIGLSLLILAALILNTINPRTVSEPCEKNEPGCGDIDFSKPGG